MMEEEENRVTYAWAQAPDLPAVLALLATGNLPTEGVDTILPTVLVAREGERLIGCAGLEVYGTVALLRSVAVHPVHRGRQLGQYLIQAILDHARHLGIHEVYLLTETASEYFPRFGFRLIDPNRAVTAASNPMTHLKPQMNVVEWVRCVNNVLEDRQNILPFPSSSGMLQRDDRLSWHDHSCVFPKGR
jgi:amino-acid N-acetyltransferase